MIELVVGVILFHHLMGPVPHSSQPPPPAIEQRLPTLDETRRLHDQLHHERALDELSDAVRPRETTTHTRTERGESR